MQLTALSLALTRIGLGGFGVGSALNLDFTSGNQSLDPRITFSRASNATVTGPDGTLQYAPNNLLTHSEQFDNSVWAKNSSSVTANAVAAPNGEFSADYVVRASTVASVTVQRTALGLGGSQTFTASIYAKAATAGNLVGLRLQGTFPSRADVVVNLLNGVVSFAGAVNYTLVSTAVSDAGNGWYRISITATADSTGVDRFIFGPTAVANGSWESSSTTVSDLYAWGAQLNVGPLQPYSPTTVKNLLGYTQEFDSAAWTKSNAFVQTNLLQYSEQFDNAAWVKNAINAIPNAAAAPDGSLTADLLQNSAADVTHYILQNVVGLPDNVIYTYSVSLKAATAGFAYVRFRDKANTFFNMMVNLSTGAIVSQSAGLICGVTAQGDGWYRCFITSSVNTGANNPSFWLYTSIDGVESGATENTGVYAWGAQLVQGSTPGDYQRTEAAAKAVMYPAPDGSLTADKLVENAEANFHRINPSTVTVVTGSTITTSVYAKAAERSGLGLFPYSSAAGARFNLAAGTVISQEAGVTASIVSVGGGWYRCSASVVAPGSSATPWILPLNASNATNYTGDGTSGIYIWGAQLSDSASLDPYVYNPDVSPTAQAYYGPRFDYDPVTLAPKGLLIEEQRTNLVWPSADFSGASWTKSNIAPASGSVTAPDGSVCGAYAGSDPSNVLKRLRFNLSTTTAGTYTWSIYLKAGTEDTCAFNLQDGTGSNGTVLTARLTDGVITVAPSVYGTATGQSASIQPVGNGFFRLSISVNFVSALTQIQAILTWDGNGASTTTGTLFPWGAQLEAGFPTSYIPTTTAAATRAADVAVMTGANFSNWYRQDEGTVYAEGGSVGNAGSLFAASDGSFNNFIAHLFQFGTTSRSWVYQGGVAQALISNNASGAIKHALSYATDDIRHSVNGAAVVLDASAVTPSVNQLSIGSRVTANNLNGHIRRISYFPRRLSDAELQGITL